MNDLNSIFTNINTVVTLVSILIGLILLPFLTIKIISKNRDKRKHIVKIKKSEIKGDVISGDKNVK